MSAERKLGRRPSLCSLVPTTSDEEEDFKEPESLVLTNLVTAPPSTALAMAAVLPAFLSRVKSLPRCFQLSFEQITSKCCWNALTPVPLPIQSPHTAFLRMPEAILRAFAANPTLNRIRIDCDPFMKELAEPFKSDSYNEIVRMKLCFLYFAATTANVNPEDWLHMIWCSLRAEIKGSGFLQHLLDKAAKILKHPEVRKVQVDVINTVLDREIVSIDGLPPPPEITVVSIREDVRAWPGLRRIYINVRAFLNGLAHPAEIVLVDLCSAMINASTQALVREVANEFNLTGSALLAGIMAEKQLFGGVQPNWMDAYDAREVPLKAFCSFERAMFGSRTPQSFPELTVGRYSARQSPESALDIYNRCYSTGRIYQSTDRTCSCQGSSKRK